LDEAGEEEGFDLARPLITLREIRDLKFDLRALRHGCGLGLSFAEIDAMEWEEAHDWRQRLGEFLEAAGVLKRPERSDGDGLPSEP